MKNIKSNKAITLISLVITIIILIILIGISIASLTGENGLISKSQEAIEKQKIESAKEKLKISILDLQTDKGIELKLTDLNEFNDTNSKNYRDEIQITPEVKTEDKKATAIVESQYEFEINEDFNVTYKGQEDIKIPDAKKDIWDGTTVSVGLDGLGTEESPFLIKSAADLIYMRDNVNSTSKIIHSLTDNNDYPTAQTAYYELKKNIQLNSDADIANIENWENTPPHNEWVPIGDCSSNSSYMFSGRFNGNGYKLIGFYIGGKENDSYKAVFGIAKDSKMERIILKDSYISGGQFIAGICAVLDSSQGLDRCLLEGNSYIIAKGGNKLYNGNIGGIVSYVVSRSSVSNCINNSLGMVRFDGTITNSNKHGFVSGIMGAGSDNLVNVYNCYNNSDVIANFRCSLSWGSTGGVVGQTAYNNVYNSYNTGNIECKTNGSYFFTRVSGVAGMGNQIQCYNYGTVNGSPANQTKTKQELLTSLNNWVDSNNAQNKYSKWTIDENINNGYPIQTWQSDLSILPYEKSNSIMVNLEINRDNILENQKYKYYIKQTNEENYSTEVSTANESYTFDNLQHNTSYDIKVLAKKYNGEEIEKKITIKTKQVTAATGNITMTPQWTSGGITGVKVTQSNTVDANYFMEYQVNGYTQNGWKKVENNAIVTDVSYGDTIYARLTDGSNTGSYSSLLITDTTGPKISITTNTTKSNYITVTATATDDTSGMPSNGQYRFYIKAYNETEYKLINTTTQRTCTFNELTQNTKYNIKVETEDVYGNTGIASKDITTITVTTATLSNITMNVIWGTRTVEGVKVTKTSSVDSNYFMEYQINGYVQENWNQVASGGTVTGVNYGDTIYVRLSDGKNTGSYTSLQIIDTVAPTVKLETQTTVNEITVTVTATDTGFGMPVNPTYKYYIKPSTQTDYGDSIHEGNNTYTYTGLTEGECYKIKTVVSDEKGNEAYKENIVTAGKQYSKISYIESTGTQYIDTGIIPINHKLDIKFDCITYNSDEHVFGTSKGYSYYHLTPYSNVWCYGKNGSEGRFGTYTNGIHILEYNNSDGNIIFDGTTVATGVNPSSTTNLDFFRRNGTTNFTGKVYYAKITDNATGEMVRNFIPAIDMEGVACLYDLAENKFYYGSKPGTLKYGE